MNKKIKVAVLNFVSAVFGILLLVFGLLSMSKHNTMTGILLFVLLVALIVFDIVLTCKFLEPVPEKIYTKEDLQTADDYALALSDLPKPAFSSEISKAKSQLERLMQKREALDVLLKKSFGNSTITIDKFDSSINELAGVFLNNLFQIIKRINLFDEKGYEDAKRKGDTSAYIDAFRFVESKIDENERILEAIDKLQVELLKLNDSPISLEDKSAMREINELIEQTKLYKQ